MITKKNKPVRVQMYFTSLEARKVWERLENVSKRTGLSVSKVASMAVRFGITEVEDRFLEEHELEAKPKSK